MMVLTKFRAVPSKWNIIRSEPSCFSLWIKVPYKEINFASLVNGEMDRFSFRFYVEEIVRW